MGIYKDMQQARKIMKITKTIDPIPENTARFREILPVFSEGISSPQRDLSQADLFKIDVRPAAPGWGGTIGMNIRSKKK